MSAGHRDFLPLLYEIFRSGAYELDVQGIFLRLPPSTSFNRRFVGRVSSTLPGYASVTQSLWWTEPGNTWKAQQLPVEVLAPLADSLLLFNSELEVQEMWVVWYSDRPSVVVVSID